MRISIGPSGIPTGQENIVYPALRFPRMLADALLLLGGLVLIYLGGRWLVGGASQLAASLGIRPFVIGLTIVGFGTSAPELALGILANVQGAGSVSLGNIIGSNIGNVTYVIAASAIIMPIMVKFEVIRKEGIAAMAGVLLLLIFSLSGSLEWWMGAIMLVFFGVYLIFFLLTLKRCDPSNDITCQFEDLGDRRWGKKRTLGLVLLGLVLLVAGAQVTVTGAVEIARGLGISEVLIGITVIAIGTTLPELTVAVLSARSKRPDLAIGNTLGTLTFNSLVVLGLGAMVSGSIQVPTAVLLTGILPMVGFSALIIIMFYTKSAIGRRAGVALFALYAAYIISLVILS